MRLQTHHNSLNVFMGNFTARLSQPDSARNDARYILPRHHRKRRGLLYVFPYVRRLPRLA
jgi:hypothetical protein